MNSLSVYLVVMNEEKNIRRVLESIKDFDDIVIVDSGSTDRTLDIAREYTDNIYHKNWNGMAEQKEYAKSLCKNDWVLNLDADEELSTVLKEQILVFINSLGLPYVGANIPIREHFMGERVHPKTKKNFHVRLFKKDKGFYGKERFHESPVLDGDVKELSGEIYHYGEVSIEVKVNKINLYSSGKALDKFDKNKKSSFVKLLFVFPVMFLKSYFLRRNFYNGRKGFISSMINAFYAFLKEAKLYEKER